MRTINLSPCEKKKPTEKPIKVIIVAIHYTVFLEEPLFALCLHLGFKESELGHHQSHLSYNKKILE